MDLCRELAIRSTFFVTANAAQVRPDDLERMLAWGHQIGCHGLTHTGEEEYNRMPEEQQRAYIEQATQKLNTLTGTDILAFRSPRLKISASTVQLLAEYGYRADSSVCSQRMDLISSNLLNPGWLLAPRRPYHPNHDNAFKRGELPIWEIPISATVIPFISACLSVLGLSFMKVLFRQLYTESRRTGKPIVYLAHPIEFAATWLKRFSFKQLSVSYIRTHGLLIRKQLYRMDHETWLNATRALFAYMQSFPNVAFVTVGEFVDDELGQVSL